MKVAPLESVGERQCAHNERRRYEEIIYATHHDDTTMVTIVKEDTEISVMM